MSTSNDELMAELREIRHVVTELQARPSLGKLLSKLLDKFFDPKIIVSLAMLLAVGGIILGRAVNIEGFGLSITTAEAKNERMVASFAADSNAGEETSAPEEPEGWLPDFAESVASPPPP